MTIATALITALVGIIGTVTAATLSNQNSERQFASETERSATEFLRTQRLTAYSAFASEANATYQAVLTANFSFPPDHPPPPVEEFNRVQQDVLSHIAKMVSAGLSVELLASDNVCEAALRESSALTTAGDRHVGDAWIYVTGQKPKDDAYRKIMMTDQDFNALQSAFEDFTRAAREDLRSDTALRTQAKKCPGG